jgi:hypothetical protein
VQLLVAVGFRETQGGGLELPADHVPGHLRARLVELQASLPPLQERVAQREAAAAAAAEEETRLQQLQQQAAAGAGGGSGASGNGKGKEHRSGGGTTQGGRSIDGIDGHSSLTAARTQKLSLEQQRQRLTATAVTVQAQAALRSQTEQSADQRRHAFAQQQQQEIEEMQAEIGLLRQVGMTRQTLALHRTTTH